MRYRYKAIDTVSYTEQSYRYRYSCKRYRDTKNTAKDTFTHPVRYIYIVDTGAAAAAAPISV